MKQFTMRNLSKPQTFLQIRLLQLQMKVYLQDLGFRYHYRTAAAITVIYSPEKR